MKTSLTRESTVEITERLRVANDDFSSRYPGETGRRQPVHTVYGGAHLYKSDSAQRLGALARRSLDHYAPDFITFAKAIVLPGSEQLTEGAGQAEELNAQLNSNPILFRQTNKPAWLAHTIYTRVLEKLLREPVEDFRIDFEDGYGNRSDAEEDEHAQTAAREVAVGMAANTISPFIGIRIKPFTEELRDRSVRTLDIFISTLLEASGGKLPDNFVVTLPKVVIPEQVAALSDLYDILENELGLDTGTLKFEIMIETTQAIINARGDPTFR